MRFTRWFYTVPLRVRSLFRRRQVEQELDEELRYHLEQQIQEDISKGLTPEEARYAALRAMDGVEQRKEECRDLRGINLIENLIRDLQYALRQLRKNPGFAAVAILTLTLGIGANTAIFSLIDRVMLESLPVRQPAQLVELLSDRGTGPLTAFSYQALNYFRAHTQACSSIIAAANEDFHALIEGRSLERLAGQYVTGDYFPTLGVSIVTGRPLTPEDDQAGAANAVAVISHAMWRDRFGSNPDAIGGTLVLESVPFTIVGVTAPDFHGLEVGKHVDVWVPLEVEPRLRRPSYTSSAAYKWLQLVGRLKPGTSFEQAQAELRVLFDTAVIENERAFSDPATDEMKNWSLSIEPAGAGLSGTRRQFSKPLLVLMAIVSVLLLIACTNVANLLFARAVAREKEIALRLSLGAGRARLIRQLLAESAVLAGAGGVLGLFTAYFVSRYLASFLANARPPLVLDVAPNLATLGFAAAVAVLTVFFFGLIPAFSSTDMDFASRLKGSASGLSSSKGRRWSGGLVVVQVAMLMVLILVAGLFIRNLHNLNSIDLGFDRSSVLLVGFDPFGSGHSPEQLKTLSAELLEKIEALPGVRTAGLYRFPPISGGSGMNVSFVIDREGSRSSVARDVYVNHVGAKYFSALGMTIIAGRDFGSQDSAAAPRVAIVNQTFAHRYFGNLTPIGRSITQGGNAMEIVGVVSDSKYSDIREAIEPTVYYDVFQQPSVPSQVLIRTERDPETVAAAARAEVRSVIGNVSIRERTLEDQIDASIVRERLVASLAAVFGGLALLLAAIGLYGVVNNSVAARTRELGIRIALGFAPRKVVLMVLRDVLTLVGAGIVLGLPLAVLVTNSIEGLLYGLTPDDPLTMLVSVCSLVAAAVLAAFLPARRASRVDPMVALRNE